MLSIRNARKLRYRVDACLFLAFDPRHRSDIMILASGSSPLSCAR